MILGGVYYTQPYTVFDIFFLQFYAIIFFSQKVLIWHDLKIMTKIPLALQVWNPIHVTHKWPFTIVEYVNIIVGWWYVWYHPKKQL